MAEQYISVGKLGKPHGLSGAFRFLFHQELKSKKKLPKYFMVQEKGSFHPWFVKKIEWLGDKEGFISFEEISSVETAKRYSKSELFLTEKDLSLFFSKSPQSIDYLVGYTASDTKKGEMGIIEEMVENTSQTLCLVKNGKKGIIIPFVDEFILKIDNRKKEIIFNLPEGLLDL